jgi:hypothetical protein
MKKDIAKIWVTALKSGDYKQGSEYLCANDRYCCLGVLCDLYLQEDGSSLSVVEKKKGDKDFTVTWYNHDAEVLPDVVQEWAGMNTNTGKYLSDILFESSLASDNDQGATFEELADIITKSVDDL